MCRNGYVISFTEYQLGVLDMVDFNGDKGRKVQSVLSYLIKYSRDGLVYRSLSKLYKNYKAKETKKGVHGKNMSRANFFVLVDTLEELKLVKKDGDNVFIIEHVANMGLDKKLDRKLDKENSSESTGITSVEADLENNNYNLEYNTYINTLYTDDASEIYVDFIGDVEIVPPVELVAVATGLLKEFKIKSSVVKNEVLSKLRGCFNVNRAGMIKYITAVIVEKKSKQESRRNDYTRNMNFSRASRLNFNNFESRDYDYDALERKLLGWA